MKKGFFTVLLSVLLSGLTAYGVVRTGIDHAAVPAVQTANGVEYRTVNLSQSEYPDFTLAAETAVDAVVYVEVTVKAQQQYQMDPFFRFFFGDEMTPYNREQKGSGSGVIIRNDGYIVTNNHVVNGASAVKVVLNNNKEYEARIIGTDPATDVAIIKIDAENLPTIEFGDSDKLRLGEWVLAIGSPLNLRSTITAGIVSAKGRSMGGYSGRGENAENTAKIESFIQTDAAVNPGNSGGALVNKEGKLVGINTAIISQTGAYSGYSFAVPVNIVKKVAADLIDFGSVKRARLGVTMQGITDEIAKEMKLSSMNGVYIVEVSKGSAAEKAGIKPKDVLTAIDGMKITDGASVQEKVNSYHPGDKAQVTLIRDGREMTVEVEFQGVSGATGTVADDGSVLFYGAVLKAYGGDARGRNAVKGVEIVSLSQGKMAEAGATEGFIIQYVNDEPVSKPEDVINIAKKARRSVFIQGVDAMGRSGYFGFGKDE